MSSSTRCKHHEYQYQIVTVREWLYGWQSNPCDPLNLGTNKAKNLTKTTLPLVDLRSFEEYCKQHLFIPTIRDNTNIKNLVQDDGVTVINLPLSTLVSGERACELPPRNVEFAILIPQNCRHSFSEANDDSVIHQLFFALESKTTSQSRKPWLVRQVLIDDDSLWLEATSMKLVTQFDTPSQSINRSLLISFHKLPRLWKPSPLVSSEVLPLLKDFLTTETRKFSTLNPSVCDNVNMKVKLSKLVLDLGSGAGRDICFLAEELKEHYNSLFKLENIVEQNLKPNHAMRFPLQFIGIDNHKGSSKRCIPLWRNRGVDDVTRTIFMDLNKLYEFQEYFTNDKALHKHGQSQSSHAGDVDSNICCIISNRYLNRKLLLYLAHSSSHAAMSSARSPLESLPFDLNPLSARLPHPLILSVGTIIAVSHFCKPSDCADWEFDHPKESNVLERWELRKMFSGGDADTIIGKVARNWRILKDEICFDGDHGRTVIQFVAMKVA